MAISAKALQDILEHACSTRKRLGGKQLSDFFDPGDLAVWRRDMLRYGGPDKLARYLDKEFRKRQFGHGTVVLVRSVPALHTCLMVVEVRPSQSMPRFYIGFTNEKFMTYKEPGA